MIPGQHVLGVVGRQEVVAGKVADHPPSDRGLVAFQELVGKRGGFMEADAGFWAGGVGLVIRAWLDSPLPRKRKRPSTTQTWKWAAPQMLNMWMGALGLMPLQDPGPMPVSRH